jgi:hypothetical protein
MKKRLSDDINEEKLNWLIESVDEILLDQEDNENDTY